MKVWDNNTDISMSIVAKYFKFIYFHAIQNIQVYIIGREQSIVCIYSVCITESMSISFKIRWRIATFGALVYFHLYMGCALSFS